jgi:hypothetical protein
MNPQTRADLCRGIALACLLACTGCSIRYDAAGVTRVGIGLWGFGDPPGVNWYLDGPRREVPELPAGPRPELPPRSAPPDWRSLDERTLASPPEVYGRTELPIGDNRGCAPPRVPEVACSMAVRAGDRERVPPRH